jgi:Ca-activated chloride channel family protein
MPSLPDRPGELTCGLITSVIVKMRSPCVTGVRPVFGTVCYLALALPAAVYSQDCKGSLSDDEIVGGIACPDGSSATVIPSDREFPPARHAHPLEEVSAEPPGVPYNEDMSAGLETVSEAGSGSAFSVIWTGPGNHRDYIAIAAPGDPANRNLDYAYVEQGSPLNLRAPDETGSYEIRYIERRSRTILAQSPITVSPASATLQLVNTVNSGSNFDVAWSGPANPRDYLAISAPDDPGTRQHNYAYVEQGSPLQLTAPDEPGDYEVRYIQRQSRVILARQSITVLPAAASLRHAGAVNSGSTFEVTWLGPGNYRDYLAIAAPDDPGTRQHNYAYVERGSTLQLTAPDEPGEYEVRYIQRQSRNILAREPIDVVPVTATLQAASVVNPGSTFNVTWTGPANYRDYLAIAEAGDPGNRQLTYAYVEKGSPLELRAPDEPGDYEVRYIQRQSRNILERHAIEVRD